MVQIKMPYELDCSKRKYKILIYGQPGIGKTTMALSMPKPLIIDADNGILRVASRHRKPVVQMTSYQEVIELLTNSDLSGFETLIFDTAGCLLDFINAHIIRQNPKYGRGGGQLSPLGWGARAATFSALIGQLNTINKHVVFVAHDKEDKSGDVVKIRPDFGGGKSGADLMKVVDAVGYMQALNGRERVISFTPNENYLAKNSAQLEPEFIVPNLNAPGSTNDFLGQVIEKISLAAQEESAEAKDYSLLIDTITAIADGVTDAESLDMARAEIAGLAHIWDSAQRAEALLTDKTAKFGREQIKQIIESVTDAASANAAIKALGSMEVDAYLKNNARRLFKAKVTRLGLTLDKATGQYNALAPIADKASEAPADEPAKEVA